LFLRDFIFLDAQGREYHDDPRRLDNWYDLRPADLRAGEALFSLIANDIPENWFQDAVRVLARSAGEDEECWLPPKKKGSETKRLPLSI
jgi:hypothetical protein